MAYLLEKICDPIDASDTIGWLDAFSTNYGKDRKEKKLFIKRFAPLSSDTYSLFPHIRKLERDTRNLSDISKEDLLIFAAIIADRGLLAAQTRDIGMSGKQSFIVTRLCYMTPPLPKERHKECKQKALNDTRPIWNAFLKSRWNIVKNCRKSLEVFVR